MVLRLKSQHFNENRDFKINIKSEGINTLTANYEITRRLRSLPGRQTTSNLVLTHIKKSTCGFLASFLKIAAAVPGLKFAELNTAAKQMFSSNLKALGTDFFFYPESIRKEAKFSLIYSIIVAKGSSTWITYIYT